MCVTAWFQCSSMEVVIGLCRHDSSWDSYPTAEETPKMYGLPKMHKANAPLRPIVASRGSITYNAARVLADVLSPLVGKPEHHIQNSGDFVNKVKDLEVPPGQKLVSYNVSALFTSIPVPDAIHYYTNAPPSPANASLNCCLSAWTPHTSRRKATSTNKNTERPWVRLCPLS